MGYKEQDQKDIGDEAGKKELSSAGSADTDKEFLRTEPLGKLLLRLALPTVTAQLINMLYNIVYRTYSEYWRDSADRSRRVYAAYHDRFRLCGAGGIWRSTESIHFHGKTG